MKFHKVEFPDTDFAAIELPEGPILSEHLTAQNSPVLFGCRSGICGTCLIEVTHLCEEKLFPPEELEADTLALFAGDNPKARLACQLNLSTHIAIKKIKSI